MNDLRIFVNLENLFLDTELPDFDRRDRKLVNNGQPFDISLIEPNLNDLQLCCDKVLVNSCVHICHARDKKLKIEDINH